MSVSDNLISWSIRDFFRPLSRRRARVWRTIEMLCIRQWTINNLTELSTSLKNNYFNLPSANSTERASTLFLSILNHKRTFLSRNFLNGIKSFQSNWPNSLKYSKISQFRYFFGLTYILFYTICN